MGAIGAKPRADLVIARTVPHLDAKKRRNSVPFVPMESVCCTCVPGLLPRLPVNGRPPAEADMMRFFRLTPPSVHQMILKLEQLGLISRQPGVPRSIVVLLDRSALPPLEPSGAQPVKTSVQRY